MGKIMPGMLIVFHTPSNAGYAMAPLERVFFEVASEIVGSESNVHFAFKSLDAGMPVSLPEHFSNVIALNQTTDDENQFNTLSSYVASNNIQIAFCFDLQPRARLCKVLRRSGVKALFSYWGSTMSAYNSGVKLMLKRLEVALTKAKPDLFIFESESMRKYATHGRGVKASDTCVIPTGVDTDRFAPSEVFKDYVFKEFNIPVSSKVAFYSGHMEERKGVRVIIEAAIELVDKRGFNNLHFLITGNRPGEEKPFLDILLGTKALNFVHFGGYRKDLDKVMPGCDIGMIASTGWDSFPMSSLEMASCGLPMIVSNLQGLVETIDDGKTGFLFEPGNHIAMADKLELLEQNEDLYKKMSLLSRARIVNHYSQNLQRKRLKEHLQKVIFSLLKGS